MISKNKVQPFNYQEEKNNEGTFFVKIFKGMEKFAVLKSILICNMKTYDKGILNANLCY